MITSRVTQAFAVVAVAGGVQSHLRGNGGGVFKSTSGGGNWTAVNEGLTNMAVVALAIDAQDPATIYAGTSGGGVFKSNDGGSAWAGVNSGLTSMDVRALVVDPQSPATVYAGTDGGVFRSIDGGGSWTNAGLAEAGVWALAVDPQGSGTVYAGTANAGVFAALPECDTLSVTPTPSARPTAIVVCVGDCDGNGTISIGEVQRCANIFLGTVELAQCSNCDRNGNGTVGISEVQAASLSFLDANACPRVTGT